MTALQILFSAAIQSTAILLLTSAVVACLRTAALKHQARVLAMAMLLALPACWLLVPAIGAETVAELMQSQEHRAPEAAAASAGGELPSFAFLVGAEARGPASPGLPAGTLLLLIWASVAATLLARTFANQWSARMLARRSVQSPWRADGIAVRLSAQVSSPAVAGILRPIILLPQSALEWPTAQLRAALAHEAAHVVRRDVASALAADLACCLYWFNPLVWRARANLSLEREIACDAHALAAGIAPADYADALLSAARAATGVAPRGALAMASVSEVEHRIRSILQPAPSRKGQSRTALSAMALLALSLPLLAAFRPAAADAEAPAQVSAAQPTAEPGELELLNPRSELIALDYAALARAAARVPAAGPEAAAIARLKAELDRRPQGIDDLVRERAIWTLSRMRAGSLLDPLLGDLQSSDWRVRAYATWGLAVVGSPRATPHLAQLLGDRVWRVRAGAAAAIEEIGDRSARQAMTAALSDPAWQVRYSAIQYFAEDPDPAERARLRALRSDPHYGTRLLVEESLGTGR